MKKEKVMKKKKEINKEIVKSNFNNYKDNLPYEENSKLEKFFKELDILCTLPKVEKKELKNDFENAFLYYHENGIEFNKAMKLLDLKNLGGFYSRPNDFWLELDDVAKTYTQFMKRDFVSVFRLSVYLKEEVNEVLLQMALNFTIKRFPSFAMSLKKGFFWHYLESSKTRYEVEKEKYLPVQRIRLSFAGSKAFRVIYYLNRISVEFFHGMTDGSGGLEFLKALVATYAKLTGKEVSDTDLIKDINDSPEASEYSNDFLKVEKRLSASGFINKKALQMGGRLTQEKPCRVLHFKMDATRLKEAAKKYETTVTSYLVTLMTLSAKAAIEERKGDISICVPVNMRKFYPSLTLRNFSMYCLIRTPIDDACDVKTLAKRVSEELKQKSSKEVMQEMMSSTAGMINSIKYIPLILKQPVLKLLYKVYGDRLFTLTISNLGVVDFGKDLTKYIESGDFVLGTTAVNRCNTSLITINNVSTLSISKLTVDPSFENKLYDLLLKDGIDIEVEGSECYGH